ncbi:MAG: sodium:calcium antiporter [Bacteroidetes bacterium]|nr:MAG: sodium:calcium antiporter [Bacteroidota bacterium]
MLILLWGGLFVLTLVTLIVAADFFIKASERIGLAMGISPFIVGVTLIAVGTSLPELVTSIIAVFKGGATSGIVPGNVIGSNITNMALVLAIVGIMGKEIRLEFDVMRVDLPMMVGSAFLLLLCLIDGHFSIWEGGLLLAGLALYLTYILALSREGKRNAMAMELEPEEREALPVFSWKDPLILLVSGVVIYFSAEYNVRAIIELATILNIGQEVIALSAVALGTSLPELIVSIVAVRVGNAEMAIGNILGSNIFNIFAVMGIPRLFGEILVPPSILSFSLPAMIVVSILTLFVLQDKRLTRWEGWALLLVYGLFLINLFSGEVAASAA